LAYRHPMDEASCGACYGKRNWKSSITCCPHRQLRGEMGMWPKRTEPPESRPCSD
jgi:hypothetical protein